MLRRTRIAAATVMAAAGLMAALAAPASAAKPGNYGTCVSGGIFFPTGDVGPANLRASNVSGGQGGEVVDAYNHSGGKSRFSVQDAC